MRNSLRTRFFLTLCLTSLVVALAVSWASRRAASQVFWVLLDGEEESAPLDRNVDVLHRDPDLELHQPELHSEAQHSFDMALLLAFAVIVVATLLATNLLSRWILGPIERLTEQARRMGSGDFSVRLECQNSNDFAGLGELDALSHTLTQMVSNLNHTESLRRNLVHDVAHELRTPLTSLQGQIEALQDGLLKPSEEILAALHARALQLTRIVDDLQELALAEAGQLAMRSEPVDLAAELRNLIQSSIPASSAMTIEDQLPESLWALGDAGRVQQILGNLLSNALRVAPAGSSLRLGGKIDNHYATLSVSDEGPGLSPKELERVFERFYRADASRDRQSGGTGLGLPIAQRLAVAMDGELRLLSPEGEGVTALLQLPECSSEFG